MDAENKKEKQNAEDLCTPGSAIKKIRDELRQWYGSLSVTELIKNKALTDEIEKIEKLFSQGVVTA